MKPIYPTVEDLNSRIYTPTTLRIVGQYPSAGTAILVNRLYVLYYMLYIYIICSIYVQISKTSLINTSIHIRRNPKFHPRPIISSPQTIELQILNSLIPYSPQFLAPLLSSFLLISNKASSKIFSAKFPGKGASVPKGKEPEIQSLRSD